MKTHEICDNCKLASTALPRRVPSLLRYASCYTDFPGPKDVISLRLYNYHRASRSRDGLTREHLPKLNVYLKITSAFIFISIFALIVGLLPLTMAASSDCTLRLGFEYMNIIV